MNHSLVAEGFGIRLRPVQMEDAAFLVWLRNLDHAKGMIGDSATDTASQEEWLKTYFERDGDYYFVIETTCGIPVGAFGYYNMTSESCDIGRWVVWPVVPAGVPSIIPALDMGFQHLGIHKLQLTVVSTNQRAINLYRRLCFREMHVETGAQIINGESVDQIHMVMEEDDWAKGRKTIMPVALMLGARIRKWEKGAITMFQSPMWPKSLQSQETEQEEQE